jgi:hypothetical protein
LAVPVWRHQVGGIRLAAQGSGRSEVVMKWLL